MKVRVPEIGVRAAFMDDGVGKNQAVRQMLEVSLENVGEMDAVMMSFTTAHLSRRRETYLVLRM